MYAPLLFYKCNRMPGPFLSIFRNYNKKRPCLSAGPVSWWNIYSIRSDAGTSIPICVTWLSLFCFSNTAGGLFRQVSKHIYDVIVRVIDSTDREHKLECVF